MENRKQVGAASSSSFTMDLFGPKHPSPPPSSSAGVFSSVFGPSSTGLGKDSSHSKYAAASSSRKHDSASYYGAVRHGATDHQYKNEAVEQPCYMSSSIYYGGQEVYPPYTHSTNSHHNFKKDNGGVEDSNENNTNDASRGNWWQGSLYY